MASRSATSRRVLHRASTRKRSSSSSLFSGSTVMLATNLDLDRGRNAAKRLRAMGAVVHLIDEKGMPVEVEIASPSNDPVVEAANDHDNTDPYDLTATAKVRHLTQITDKRVVETPPKVDQRKIRWRYRFDTFMAKGGGSIFKALTAVFVGTVSAHRPAARRDVVAGTRSRPATREHRLLGQSLHHVSRNHRSGQHGAGHLFRTRLQGLRRACRHCRHRDVVSADRIHYHRARPERSTS